MASGGGSDGEFGLQIAPLLDVLFVLLLFFMVTAGSQEREAELGIRLPSMGSLPSTPQTIIRIDILADGQVMMNDAEVDSLQDPTMPVLKERLKDILTKFDDQPVIITPSLQTQHQRVVDVLNACSSANVKNLAFGAPSS
jgi:biopolymer transport protein ExbD